MVQHKEKYLFMSIIRDDSWLLEKATLVDQLSLYVQGGIKEKNTFLLTLSQIMEKKCDQCQTINNNIY